MKEKKRLSGNIFDSARDYYQQDWHDYYTTIIKLVQPHCSVLDVGCGRGGLLEYLRDKQGCRVTGLDISEEVVRICAKRGIEVMMRDVEVDEIPGAYDVIILSAVLEHLMNPPSILSKLRDNLNDNGYLIVGVPNFSDILSRIQYLRGKNVKVFGDTDRDKKLGIQPPGHVQFFNEATLSFLLERTGYKPTEWSYHKSSFSKQSSASFHKRILRWIIYKLYQIDCPLFSVFIAVKAVKA